MIVLARVALLEALGHPVTLLLTLASVVVTLALPMLQFQQFTEDGRLARDCGLSTAMLIGLVLAAGGACRLTRALQDGTAALALTKPFSRSLWLCGHAAGTALSLALYLFAQGGAVLVAEWCSPRYHAGERFANARVLGVAFALTAGALALAALNHRFRRGRFLLTASLLLPLGLWGMCCVLPGIHWGSLSALAAIGLWLAQATACAAALAVFCPPGVTVGLTLAFSAVAMAFFGGSAYLPLDRLADGGAVPWRVLAALTPQSVCATVCFLWCGAQALRIREVS